MGGSIDPIDSAHAVNTDSDVASVRIVKSLLHEKSDRVISLAQQPLKFCLFLTSSFLCGSIRVKQPLTFFLNPRFIHFGGDINTGIVSRGIDPVDHAADQDDTDDIRQKASQHNPSEHQTTSFGHL